jgi:hypothetical protein
MYEIIILPVVLYGREAWSLTLREEGRTGPKRDEVTGGWRKLQNGKLIICTLRQV